MQSREALANHYHGLVQISRNEIFAASDAKCAPINLPIDTATMFAGYVGARYRQERGLLLLAINPGGGGDTYTVRTPEDEVFYPLLINFKSTKGGGVQKAFERINESFVPIVQRWNLWRILGPTLDAAGKTIEEVAFMNVIPYRTRSDMMPPAAARNTAWRLVVEPTLAILQPEAVVTLGKKAGAVVERLYAGERHLYCVPRTTGDAWISDEALAVHRKMRSELHDA